MKINNLELEYLGFKNIKKEDKKIFITLSADYGNVGDMGITVAQIKILQQIFPNRKIIEIPMFKFYDLKDEIYKILNNDDICTIIGGGNFGNTYIEAENRRREIIKIFENNKIITFPQSISFSNTEDGQKELRKSVEIYGAHKDLTILAREEKSYNIIKSNFKNQVILVPDIVFYLKEKLSLEPIPRKYISICFRDDKEKSIDSDATEKLSKYLNENNFNDIKLISTHIGNRTIQAHERNSFFEKCLNDFVSSKVIITDRLHGLIFSIITNTPCIVFDNSNKKISATYNTWLKNTPLIQLMDEYNEEKILEYIKNFSKIESPKIVLNDNINFEEIFKILQEN